MAQRVHAGKGEWGKTNASNSIYLGPMTQSLALAATRYVAWANCAELQ